MVTTSGRGSSKERLLDAAVDIISAQGVQGLTLEGVAAATGVTKGGLIYHFKTKDDLLAAVGARLLDQLDQRSKSKAASQGNTLEAIAVASVEDTFAMPENEKRLLSMLLQASFNHPELIGVAQKYYGFYNDADFGAATGEALAISAALDGIVLLELLRLHQFTPAQRDAMRDALLQRAHALK